MSEAALETYKSILSQQFNSHFSIQKKRPDIFQLRLPFYHEDGDMIEIYFKELDSNKVRISDYGMSLMRLSYNYEIDSDSKRKVLNRILSENFVEFDDGQIFLISDKTDFFPSLMQLISTVQKVTNMRQFKRDVISSMFYEYLDEFIDNSLQEYSPEKDFVPAGLHDVYSVDYKFSLPKRNTPVFLYGVKGKEKAKNVALNCYNFQTNKIPFHSVVIHDDFEKLSKKDRKYITDVVDKQFTELNIFIDKGAQYFNKLDDAA